MNGTLAAALITRAGMRREEGGWAAPDGRPTSADAEALRALVALAARPARVGRVARPGVTAVSFARLHRRVAVGSLRRPSRPPA